MARDDFLQVKLTMLLNKKRSACVRQRRCSLFPDRCVHLYVFSVFSLPFCFMSLRCLIFWNNRGWRRIYKCSDGGLGGGRLEHMALSHVQIYVCFKGNRWINRLTSLWLVSNRSSGVTLKTGDRSSAVITGDSGVEIYRCRMIGDIWVHGITAGLGWGSVREGLIRKQEMRKPLFSSSQLHNWTRVEHFTWAIIKALNVSV